MDLTNLRFSGATDPATVPTGTTPGCFANPPQVGGLELFQPGHSGHARAVGQDGLGFSS